MADKTIDTSLLPEDVRLKLEELEIELAEGDITQKGYEKKRTRLLANYVSHSPAEPSAPSPQTAAQRKAHRRLTREDNRYHSEIRTEAVMQALALHKKTGCSSAIQTNICPVSRSTTEAQGKT